MRTLDVATRPVTTPKVETTVRPEPTPVEVEARPPGHDPTDTFTPGPVLTQPGPVALQAVLESALQPLLGVLGSTPGPSQASPEDILRQMQSDELKQQLEDKRSELLKLAGNIRA